MRKHGFLLLVTIAFVLSLPTTALAQEAPVPEALTSVQTILSWMLKLVIIGLGAVLAWASVKVIKYVEAKLKIDIPEKYEHQLMVWADRGIAYANERAQAAMRESGGKLKPSGNEKMSMALDFVLEAVRTHKLDQIAEEKLRKYIEARLGQKRE